MPLHTFAYLKLVMSCHSKLARGPGPRPVASRGLVMPGATAWLYSPYQNIVLSSGVWWSLLPDICCLWRHNPTSYSRLQTNVVTKFV